MKAYIYKLYDNTNANIYYGSTKELVSKRIAKHRAAYKRYLNGKGNYVKSFDILKNNDYSYCVVEEVEYENKWELLNKERYYIENNDCVNKVIPNRTNKEYKEDNKEIIAEKQKIYNEHNKEIIAKKMKIYYEDNKEILSQKAKEKITCECGCIVCRVVIARHKKTKKHLLFLETLQ